MNKKHIIISFLAGAAVIALAYQIWLDYQFNQMKDTFWQDHQALGEVIEVINK